MKAEPHSDADTNSLSLANELIKDEQQPTPGIFSYVKCEDEVRHFVCQ